VVWCGTGLVAFSSGLRGRLHSSIQDLADRLAEQQLSEGLYPDLEQECDEIDREVQRLTELHQMVNDFRGQLARSQVSLGSLRISGQPDS
jgi:hypothetical protein